MKLIRYLLSHIILLAFLVALGFAYYYRAHLFSDNINARIDSTVHRVMVLVKLSPEQPEASEQSLPVTETEPRQADTVAAQEAPAVIEEDPAMVAQVSETDAEATKDEASTSQPAADPAIAPATDTVTEAAIDQEQAQATEATTDDTVEATEPATEQVTEADSAEPDPVPATAPAPADSTPEQAPQVTETVVAQGTDVSQSVPATEPDQTAAASTDKEAVATSHAELIGQARLAFQSGDSNKAISLYQELSDLNPDDPNAYGEMGNVLYAQGKWKEAGKAYYEAAIRLKRQGRMGQVQYLFRVIQGLDQESAEKLRSQLAK